VRPRGIVAVNSAQGDEMYYVHAQRTRVLPETTAFQMITMLQDVIGRGTGARVRDWGVPGMLGGKTGTTNDYRDAWFVGFSPSVVAGVWVGFDRPAPIRDGASGARAALPIWADFMKRSARRLPSTPIAAPAGLQAVRMCRVSYHRAVDGCPGYTEYFKDGDDIPSALCPLHPGTFGQSAKRAIQGVLGKLFGRIVGKKD
jgi:penicillin-binding protein 1A